MIQKLLPWILAAASLIFGFTKSCDRQDPSSDNQFVVDQIQGALDAQTYINETLGFTNDSLMKVNLEQQKEIERLAVQIEEGGKVRTQTFTKITTDHKMIDSVRIQSQEIDSLELLLAQLKQDIKDSEPAIPFSQRLEAAVDEALEQAASIPCTINFSNEWGDVTTTCIQGYAKTVEVSARDTLTINHITEKVGFLGLRKIHRVLISNENPYVDIEGTQYVIDKKQQRQLRRQQRRLNRKNKKN